MLGFVGALFTMMLGRIPQQDVFQRVVSAKAEKIARRRGARRRHVLLFAFIPMFLAYAATLIDPAMVAPLLASQEKRASQQILPQLILGRAVLRAGDVLRRPAVGHQELRVGDAAGAVCDVRGEHPEARVQERHRCEPAEDDGSSCLLPDAGHALLVGSNLPIYSWSRTRTR